VLDLADPPTARFVAHAPVVGELLHLGVRPLRHRLGDPRVDRVAPLERAVVMLDVRGIRREHLRPRSPVAGTPGFLRDFDVVIVRALQLFTRPLAHQPVPKVDTPSCSHCSSLGGTSSAGLRSKNPTGISMKPVYSTGMTGQSSGRTKCVSPNVYQTTTSVPAIGRSCADHRGKPSPPSCWFGYSPAARRSSEAYGVTHKLCCANAARRPIGESGCASSVGVDIVGTSLYAVGWPIPFRASG